MGWRDTLTEEAVPDADQQPTQPASTWRSTLVEEPLDSQTGEPLPAFANGSTPQTPIRQSPVSVVQNLWLGLGNDPGRLKYLKENFEDAQQVINEEGQLERNEFVVKHKGSWYTVDAPGFGEGSGGDQAWEFAKDFVRKVPEATKIGVSLTAGATATPLAGFLTGAGLEALRTSLGRVVGTYEAGTPIDQVVDAATEGLWNAGAIRIAQGIKPTARWIADRLPEWSKNVKILPDKTKAIVRDTLGKLSLMGPENFDVMLEHPREVANVMKLADDAAKASKAEAAGAMKYTDHLVDIGSKQVDKLAEAAAEARKVAWNRAKMNLKISVPSNFDGGADEMVRSLQADAVNRGLAEIRIPKDKLAQVVKGAVSVSDGATTAPIVEEAKAAAKAAVSKPLSKEAAIDFIRNNKGILPEGVEFSLKNPDDVVAASKASGVVDPVYGSKESVERLFATFNNVVNRFKGVKEPHPSGSADQLVEVGRALNEELNGIIKAAKVEGKTGLMSELTKLKGAAQGYIDRQFNKYGMLPAYENLKASYGKMSDDMAALIKINGLVGAKKVAAQRLFYKQLSSGGGEQLAVKKALDSVITASKKHLGQETAAAIDRASKMIKVTKAAEAARPLAVTGKNTNMVSKLMKQAEASSVQAIGRRFQPPQDPELEWALDKLNYSRSLLGDNLWRSIDKPLAMSLFTTQQLLKGPYSHIFYDGDGYERLMNLTFSLPGLQKLSTQQLLQSGPSGARVIQDLIKQQQTPQGPNSP